VIEAGEATTITSGDDDRANRDPRVSTFELFFDLVFVFALTRVTESLARDPSWSTLGQGVLIFAVLWWAWGAYAWLTNAMPTDEMVPRLVVLAAMAAMLVVALAVPTAFDVDAGDSSLAFALGYLVVIVLHDVLFAVAADDLASARPAIMRLGATNLAGALLLLGAAFVDGHVQTGLWIAAVAVTYVGPYLTGVAGFTARPGHFAERHGLIVIIALGESIVALGAAGSPEVDGTLATAALLAIVLTGALWWAYFDREGEQVEATLRAADGPERSRLARDLYSYLHIPLVFGVVLTAVGMKQVLAHSDEHLEPVVAFALGGGVTLYFAALVALRLRCGRRPNAAQLAILPMAAVTMFMGTDVTGMTTLAVLAVLAMVAALSSRVLEP
jgi:low temperature requirement protein LtrA